MLQIINTLIILIGPVILGISMGYFVNYIINCITLWRQTHRKD